MMMILLILSDDFKQCFIVIRMRFFKLEFGGNFHVKIILKRLVFLLQKNLYLFIIYICFFIYLDYCMRYDLDVS